MLERFLEHVRSRDLIPAGSRILVGYSGGPDSTCLVHLLKRGDFDVVAAHLNHKQRTEADQELKLCEAWCKELDVPFISGAADVPGMAADLKVSLEEAGRIARYEFFTHGAIATGCDLIATAHTQDDLVETVLLHITRGTGLSGLAGIPEQRDYIVRPLLAFTREETVSYCEANGLWTHGDPANTDLKHSRARLRALVVPKLREINPELGKSIARLATIAKEESEFLDGMAAAALEKCEVPLNGELAFLTRDVEVAFNCSLLSHLPDVLLKRALRLAAEAVGGSLDFKQVGIAFEGVRSGSSGSVTSEQEAATLSWGNGTLTVHGKVDTCPFRHSLTVPGETISDEFGWSISAFKAAMPKINLQRSALETYLDTENLKGALYFRSWKVSDEMRPLGFSGHRKLSDLMSESGLTIEARRRLPVVCDIIGPVWVPGVCVDERARADKGSTEALLLKFGPVPVGAGAERNGTATLGVR